MRLHKPTPIRGLKAGLAMALMGALAVSGCKKEPPPPEPEAPVSLDERRKSSMRDPEYIAKLNKRLEGRKEHMKKVSAARQALAEAKAAETPDADLVKKLEEAALEAERAFAKYEQASQKIVEAQVKKDFQVGQTDQRKGK